MCPKLPSAVLEESSELLNILASVHNPEAVTHQARDIQSVLDGTKLAQPMRFHVHFICIPLSTPDHLPKLLGDLIQLCELLAKGVSLSGRLDESLLLRAVRNAAEHLCR